MSALPRRDLILALVLAGLACTEAALLDAEPIWFALVAGLTLPFAARRTHPLGVVCWVLALFAIAAAAGGGPDDSLLPLPVLLLLALTAGGAAPDARTAAALATAIVVVIGLAFGPGSSENTAVEDLVALAILVAAAAAVGHVLRVRAREQHRLHGLTLQLTAEQEQRAREAVRAERARVARELHDVIAHSVSIIAIQASAAESLLGRDEARARESLLAVQDAARGALGEMRRLLSVLRTDEDEGDGRASRAGLDALPLLLDEVRASGLPVGLRERGARPELAPGLDLSVYRVVQEALTNVRKHAGCVPTEVTLDYEPAELVVEVASALGTGRPPRPETGAGLGLLGMEERARIYGGTFEAGARGDRFVVRLRLPTDEVVA